LLRWQRSVEQIEFRFSVECASLRTQSFSVISENITASHILPKPAVDSLLCDIFVANIMDLASTTV